MLTGTKRAAAVVVVILNCCGLALAHAANIGTATNVSPQSIVSGSWKGVPSLTSISPVLKSTSGTNFNITNTGTLALKSLTVKQVTTGGVAANTVTIDYCRSNTTSASVAWSGNACPAGSTKVNLNTATGSNSPAGSSLATSFTVNLAANGVIQARCQYSGATNTITDTISVIVAATDVRTSTITNA